MFLHEEKNSGVDPICFESSLFIVFWSGLVDDKRVGIYPPADWKPTSNFLDDCDLRRVYGAPVVSLYAGKTDHMDDCYGAFEAVISE